MIIVIIVITILIGILEMYMFDECFGAGLIFLGELIALIFLINGLVNMRVIDTKIELYSQQNIKIESKVENAVKQYMEYENKTFTELKNEESYITLVSLYPELKSDELIKKEIEIYEENNKKILSLKEEKTNKTIYRWWLYFGK